MIDVVSTPVGLNYYETDVQVVMRTAQSSFPVSFHKRQIDGISEIRYAFANQLGDEAVVCYTARDPSRPQRLRLTQTYRLEVNRGRLSMGGTGLEATFVPVRSPVLSPASDEPCH